MRRLLNKSELRQLGLVEILYARAEWITFSELAKSLDCSVRILKDDVVYFKKIFKEFTIESSNSGIRLVVNDNVGLKFFYQHTLRHSTNFRILEAIFLEEGLPIKEITHRLNISTSTIYRLIEQINDVIVDYNFQIGLNPCKIIGNERKIRHFYYNYFNEKYTYLNWPFDHVHQDGMNRFLQFFLDFTNIQADFAFFNIFKIVTTVNFIRYKNEHYVDTNGISFDFKDVICDVIDYVDVFKYFEETNHEKVTNLLIKQLFTPYLGEGYSLTYARLEEKMETNAETKAQVFYLGEMLENVSRTLGIQLHNKNEIILAVLNALHLEDFKPLSGHVIYNYKKEIAWRIKGEYPRLYSALYQGILNFSHLLNQQLTEECIYSFVYLVFRTWSGLLPDLRRKYVQIKLIVISDESIAHANMIKELIEYEFPDQILVTVYDRILLDDFILEHVDADILVANFALPKLQNKRTVIVDSVPTFFDFSRIQKTIDETIIAWMQEKHFA